MTAVVGAAMFALGYYLRFGPGAFTASDLTRGIGVALLFSGLTAFVFAMAYLLPLRTQRRALVQGAAAPVTAAEPTVVIDLRQPQKSSSRVRA